VVVNEPEINEETEIKFEMEREKQTKLLERQKILNQKLMRAMGKQNSLTKKLYKYKQLLIKEGYSDLVESTKINKIQISESGEVYDFDEKYRRFNEEGDDEPVYSNKFIKKSKQEIVKTKANEKITRKNPKLKFKKAVKQKSDEANSYMNQYSSKRLLGETGNQKKNPKKTGKLRTTTKSAKNLRETPTKKKPKKGKKEKTGKLKKREKSSKGGERTGRLTKNYSMKSHKTYEDSHSRSQRKSKKSKNRKKSNTSGYKVEHKPRVSSGFQKMDKLQAKRIERREQSNKSSK
jgi:hypothetical protein